jgi:HEAT repeat protein
MGSLVIPIAIVLIGALIIFGVTKLLSSERNYRDLVQELQSKTFGNKWIAAYELSKKLATAQIPAEEIPFIVKTLDETYTESIQDPRTRDFVIVALGVLKSPLGVPVIYRGLKDSDTNVVFHSLVALANMPKGSEMANSIDWSLVTPFLKHDDLGFKQAAIMALSTHLVKSAEEEILSLTNDTNKFVRYSSATALINFKNKNALPILSEILKLEAPQLSNQTSKNQNPSELDYNQVAQLKLGLIESLERNNWKELNADLVDQSLKESNQQVALRMKEALNKLKN